MDSLKVINDVISEKIKRNLSMVEFHKKEVERYESIISELDELRDNLEFEFDCEDQTYKYNDQTQRFDKVTDTKEYNFKFCSPLSLIKDYESDDDEDDDTDLFRDEFDDDDGDESGEVVKKLRVGCDCLYCKDGWIEMVDDGLRKTFRCPECDYVYSWRDVEYD